MDEGLLTDEKLRNSYLTLKKISKIWTKEEKKSLEWIKKEE